MRKRYRTKQKIFAEPEKTRIWQFSAYMLVIFTEYTAWAAFGGVSWKWPEVTFYMSISIIAYLICLLLANQNRYANEVLNMRI